MKVSGESETAAVPCALPPGKSFTFCVLPHSPERHIEVPGERGASHDGRQGPAPADDRMGRPGGDWGPSRQDSTAVGHGVTIIGRQALPSLKKMRPGTPGLKTLLDYSTIQMTMRYAYLAPGYLKQAVDVLARRTSITTQCESAAAVRQSVPILVPVA